MPQEVLRDRNGYIIGYRDHVGNEDQLRDRNGRLVGRYDHITDRTRGSDSHLVGFGDHLVRLLDE